jgi:hypothetical protein
MKNAVVILCGILLTSIMPAQVYAQEKQATKAARTKVRFFEIGTGLPSLSLRDRLSSSLAYSGSGLAGLHLGNTRQKGSTMYKQFGIDLYMLNAKPAIANLSDWHKSANMYAFSFLYRHLSGLPQHAKQKWQCYIGASIGLNGHVSVIPAVNNALSYNFNWLQAGLEAMATRNFKWKKKHFLLTYQASLPFAGLTVRPQSYVGLQPTPAIWQQDGDDFGTMFNAAKFSSLHNLLMFRNDLSLDIQLRKNKLRLQYFWQYSKNTVAVNSVTSALSSINIVYLIKLSNR